MVVSPYYASLHISQRQLVKEIHSPIGLIRDYIVAPRYYVAQDIVYVELLPRLRLNIEFTCW